mmetsp:Transcript_4772/g.19070  ORF Transcript_4772/g.19070 Transcript_4772/m.19070 type:complete len:202 (+) Transcript_4772:923-1528(+)
MSPATGAVSHDEILSCECRLHVMYASQPRSFHCCRQLSCRQWSWSLRRPSWYSIGTSAGSRTSSGWNGTCSPFLFTYVQFAPTMPALRRKPHSTSWPAWHWQVWLRVLHHSGQRSGTGHTVATIAVMPSSWNFSSTLRSAWNAKKGGAESCPMSTSASTRPVTPKTAHSSTLSLVAASSRKSSSRPRTDAARRPEAPDMTD